MTELVEWLWKKKVLILNMIKRERLSKNSKKAFNFLKVKLKEKKLCKWKSMRILRDNRKNLYHHMKVKTPSLEIKMTNLTMLLTQENKVSEIKSITGNLNSMKSKDNMLIFKVNSRKKKLFGKVNLNSLKSKKSKLRETKKKDLNNSKLLSINYKRLIMIANPRMSKIMVWLCNSLNKNSKGKRKNKKRIIPNKTSNSKRLLKDSKKKTKLWTKDLSSVKTIVNLAQLL